jgi:hypothetical protein
LCLDQVFRPADIEIVVLTRIHMVALAQQTGNLTRRFGHRVARDGRAKNVIQPESAGDSLLDCGKGQEHEVVLVLTHGRKSFCLQDTCHLARQTLNSDGRPDWVIASEQVVNHGLTQHTDRSGGVNVGLGKKSAPAQPPTPNLDVLRRHAPVPGGPVLTAVNHLNVAIYIGRHAPDQRHLLADGQSVTEHQRPDAARTGPHAISVTAARFDPDKIIPQVLQLFFYPAGARVPDSNDADKRGYTDRDSEDGKGRCEASCGSGLRTLRETGP